jgi:hypothetical protein
VLVVTVASIVQSSRTGLETGEHLASTEETDRDKQTAPIEDLIDAIFKRKEMIEAAVPLPIVGKEISVDQEGRRMTCRLASVIRKRMSCGQPANVSVARK